MANLTGQDLINMLSDILLSDVKSNTELSSDSNNQFDPNHIEIPTLPRSFDKLLAASFSKNNIIQAANELYSLIENVDNTSRNNLNQQFSVIGDFISFPDKKSDMQKIGSDILDSLRITFQDIHGPDLDNPIPLGQFVASQLSFNSPLIENSGDISLSVADSVTDGYLTSTDWNSFNSKENPLTFSSPFNRVGDVISITVSSSTTHGIVSSVDWNTFNNKENVLTFNGPLNRSGDSVNIYQASSSADGYLTSTDWTTFNNKENIITFSSLFNRVGDSVTITQSNSTTDGYLSSSDWVSFNNKQSQLNFQAPLIYDGGVISVPVATASVDGYLSSDDWSNFNSKESSLTFSSPFNRVGNTVNLPQATSSVSGYLASSDWTVFNSKAPVNNPTFTGVVTVPTPVNSSDAATKGYVDAISSGLDPKASCFVATTSELLVTPSGSGIGKILTDASGSFPSLVIDGIAVPVGKRVLVKNQTTSLHNGIYELIQNGDNVSLPWILSRASDFDGSPTNEISGGNFTFIEFGSSLQNTGWVLQGSGDLNIDVDPLVWVQFSGAGQIDAGLGMSKIGNSLYVNVESPIFINGDNISIYASNASTNGYLSSIDWNTFNNKENVLNFSSSFNRVGNNVDIKVATASQTGALTSSDWISFDSKEDALTFSSPFNRVSNTVSLPQATSAISGYLSSTDWLSFNNKESQLTFDGPLSRSLNSISIPKSDNVTNGYLSSIDWNTFNNKESVLTFSGPLSRDGGNTVTITKVTSTTEGYLSSTDWNTFNAKENALTFSSVFNRVGDNVDIKVASSSQTGLLTASDWNLFNSKGEPVVVENTLSSSSTVNALSAYQGNVLATAIAYSSVVFVDINRIDPYVETGSASFPYKSIQNAVTNSPTYSRLFLSSGYYTVSHDTTIHFKEGMVVEGCGIGTVIQAALNNTTPSSTNLITFSDRVKVSNILFKGNNDYTKDPGDPSRQVKGINEEAQNLIYLNGVKEARIQDCFFTESTLDAIRIINSQDCFVVYNHIKGNGKFAVYEDSNSSGNIIDGNITRSNGLQEV